MDSQYSIERSCLICWRVVRFRVVHLIPLPFKICVFLLLVLQEISCIKVVETNTFHANANSSGKRTAFLQNIPPILQSERFKNAQYDSPQRNLPKQIGIPRNVNFANFGNNNSIQNQFSICRTLTGLKATTSASNCTGYGCRIISTGSAVPETVLTNDDLSQVVDTSDEWIYPRTGISSRRVLKNGESLRSLAIRACQNALDTPSARNTNVRADNLSFLTLASSSPDDMFGDAAYIANQINVADTNNPNQSAVGPLAFDITAACSGFLIGLINANAHLSTPCTNYQTAMLVGADALSRWVDWTDRSTCILFGDGAGAITLKRNNPLTDTFNGKPLGLLSYSIHSNGGEYKHLELPFHGQATHLNLKSSDIELSKGMYSPISMNGREVFKFVSRSVPSCIEDALKVANLNIDQVDWLLLHQANKRIIDVVAEKLNIDSSKVLSNLSKYGNTSAASIPICLDEAVREGKIKKGDVIAMAGFGAGLTWGAAIVRYG